MDNKIQLSLDDAIRHIVKEELNLFWSKFEKLFENLGKKEEYSKPLNFEEALNYLNCSKSYLYKMTSTNRAPHSKRGKRIYFDKTELDIWLLSNKIKTVTEIEDEAENYLASVKKGGHNYEN